MMQDSATGASNDQSAPILIVGLGNPGRKYRQNRHNVGFLAVDQLARRLGLTFSRVQSQALLTSAHRGDQKILLAKPQTYMNLSGRAVRGLVRFFRVPLNHLLVVYDELDLPFGVLRMRPAGGAGGHQGMRSVIQELGSNEFPRLRVGVGRPPGRMDPAAYLLQDFSKEEMELLPPILEEAAESILTFIDHGIQQAMTEFNRIDRGNSIDR